MILSQTVVTSEELAKQLRWLIRHESMHKLMLRPDVCPKVQIAPIRMLVPQDTFTRGQVASIAHEASFETGVPLFTSFVKVDDVSYWVIQEDRSHAKTGS